MKENKSKKMKKISRAVCIISKIGYIMALAAIVIIIIAGLFFPFFINDTTLRETYVDAINVEIINVETDEEVSIEETINEVDKNVDENENEDVKVTFSDNVKPVIKFIENKEPWLIILAGEIMVIAASIVFYVYYLILKNINKLFKNFYEGETPFTSENVSMVKKIARLMILSIILSLFTTSGDESMFLDFDLNITSMIEILVLSSLGYIFDYGYELQIQADETL